jgi:hypothetical protein
MESRVKRIRLRVLWIVMVVFGCWMWIALAMEERDRPPELARISELRVEYYIIDDGWVNSASIPSSARRLRICGMMEKSKMATLQVRISEPNDKNKILFQNEYFFDLQPGEFCVDLSLVGEVVPGEYVLWMLDIRNTVARLGLVFFDD